MKKVLVLLPYANIHLELFIKFIQRNYNADFYIHRDISHYRKNILNNDLKLPSIGYWRSIRNLTNHKYEIIFTHGIFYPYLLFLHVSSQNKIIILSEGFKQNFNNGIKGILKRIHLRYLAKLNSISVFMLGEARIKKQYENLAPYNIKYFQYGMFPDLNIFSNFKSPKTDPLKFVFAGQFINRKNIRLILDAITLTSQFQTGEAEFTFIGEGPLEQEIRASQNVKLHETLSKEKLLEFLSKSDVLVLVSTYEGWGAIVNEACACGCALILTQEIGAATLFFKDQENGFYSGTTANSLSSIFSLLLQDRNNLIKMKEASHSIFQELYQNHDKMLLENIMGATNAY